MFHGGHLSEYFGEMFLGLSETRSDMSVLINREGSCFTSWVVKYKIKYNSTIKKSTFLLPRTVFVPVLLDLQLVTANKVSTVGYLWEECAQYRNSESQTVQMHMSESLSLWFCSVGFYLFDLFVFLLLVIRLQYS